jgi:hypothetical protein
MDKTEIINLTEASGVSDNDYVMVDSPTLGVRKYSASNLQGGGSGEGLNYYLYKGNVGGGASATAYPTVALNKPLDAGCYLAILEDQTGLYGSPSINNMTVFSWGVNSTSLAIVLRNFRSELTQTQIQATKYEGDWRDLFLYIIKIG